MRLNRQQPKSALLGSRERLLIIVLAQYGLLFLSALACAAAIYLAFVPFNTLFTASNVTTILAAVLSISYLLMHQCGAWRYSRGGIKLPLKKRNVLLAWSRIANIVSIPMWTAGSVLGLFIAIGSSFCKIGPDIDADRRGLSINDCKMQKANIAVTLAASVLSVILFCVLATAERPFAASLAGIHLRDHREEELLHLSSAEWPSPSPPHGATSRCSFDTSIYAPSFQSTTPRQDNNWLPKLSFDTPTDKNHPARRVSSNDIQSLRHKESNLLPSPAALHCSKTSSPMHSIRGRTTFKRSATANTAPSSIYSQSTAADSSTFSKRASSISSFSDDSSFFSPLKSPPPLARTFSCSPAVPSIPEQYLTTPTTDDLWNQDMLEDSKLRPRMPSTQFWNVKQNDLQGDQYLTEGDPPFSTPRKRFRRHTELSLDCKSLENESIIVQSNLNRSNTTKIGGRVGKWTYESFRKGRSIDAGIRNTWALPSKSDKVEEEDDGEGGEETLSPSLGRVGRSRAERRRSRTLVKKRQPGNIAARVSIGNVCAL